MNVVFNPFSLEGKHVLVTGASSGIGKAIAIACSKMGATIYLTARNKSRLQETLIMLENGQHQILPADLTKEEDRNMLVQQLPLLDGVVQSAGVGGRTLCRSIKRENINDIFFPNFQAPVLLQTALLEQKKIRCPWFFF